MPTLSLGEQHDDFTAVPCRITAPWGIPLAALSLNNQDKQYSDTRKEHAGQRRPSQSARAAVSTYARGETNLEAGHAATEGEHLRRRIAGADRELLEPALVLAREEGVFRDNTTHHQHRESVTHTQAVGTPEEGGRLVRGVERRVQQPGQGLFLSVRGALETPESVCFSKYRGNSCDAR